MFQDIVQRSAKLIKPSIDVACKVNGIECNIYYKKSISTVTPITGRGDVGTNNLSYMELPDFYKKPLLIAEQTKVGYKGAKKSDNSIGAESIDTLNTDPQTYIISYDNQYGIDWKTLMKIELFYTKGKTYPDAVYQTTKVLEMPLTNKSTIHSGLLHIYLVPMM